MPETDSLPVPRLPDRLRQSVGSGRDSRPPGTLSEVFAERSWDGAPTGFVLASLVKEGGPGPLLWVQDRLSRREAGVPCQAGLPEVLAARGLLYLSVSRPVDVLWALEQGLSGAALGGVIGEIWGDPQVLDFTATKRLALRAEAQGLPCWLLRRGATAALSAARNRWRVSSLPSLPDADDIYAPGQALWKAELFRSRWARPGTWVARAEPGLVLDHGIAADGMGVPAEALA